MNEVGLLQAVLQAGAFGLLTWLAVYWLPRVSNRMADSYDACARTFSEALTHQLSTFQSELKYEREQCQRQFEVVLAAQAKTLDLVKLHHEAALVWMAEHRAGDAVKREGK